MTGGVSTLGNNPGLIAALAWLRDVGIELLGRHRCGAHR